MAFVFRRQKKMIPACTPALFGKEREYVLDAIDTNWISSAGKYIPKFEKAFSEYCGVKHGISVTNGTNALHLALTALGVGRGDEVIIPDFTMIASAFAVCYTGARPVFVDSEKDTWNINPRDIERKITDKTKVIMSVPIYGHPCEMETINEIAGVYGIKTLEDAAEAHGAEYNGVKCGSLSDIACFSFFANKVVTTGEGGMVVTNDDELADKCRYYKNLCFSLKGARNYIHEDIGFNYRMSNIHAAIGLAQTEKADDYVNMRRKNNSLYRKYLSDVEGIIFQAERENVKNVYWMNGIIVDKKSFGMNRDKLMEGLKESGVDSRLFFNGMHRQPSLRKYECDLIKYEGDFFEGYPVSDYISENGLLLPSGSGLKEEEIIQVCDAIRSYSKNG